MSDCEILEVWKVFPASHVYKGEDDEAARCMYCGLKLEFPLRTDKCPQRPEEE